MNSWDLSHLSTAHINHLVELIGGGCELEECGTLENGKSLFHFEPQIKYVSGARALHCLLFVVCSHLACMILVVGIKYQYY